MTLSQLEKYIAAEVENLHIKIDLLTERMDERFDTVIEQLKRIASRLDRIEDRLATHEARIIRIEQKA